MKKLAALAAAVAVGLVVQAPMAFAEERTIPSCLSGGVDVAKAALTGTVPEVGQSVLPPTKLLNVATTATPPVQAAADATPSCGLMPPV